MKTCSKCNQAKPTNEFSRDARTADGLRADCKSCAKSYNAAWRANNTEKQRARLKEWRSENPERSKELRRAAMQRAYAADPEKHRDRSRSWAARNRDVRAAKQARRTGVCSWANSEKIREIYEFAQEFRTAGFDVEVDHIEPLRGKTVCGLHVEHNLRVCLTDVNRTKRNHQMEHFQ